MNWKPEHEIRRGGGVLMKDTHGGRLKFSAVSRGEHDADGMKRQQSGEDEVDVYSDHVVQSIVPLVDWCYLKMWANDVME